MGAGTLPAAAQQPDGALRRAFQPGDIYRYRVELVVRSEVAGQRPARVSGRTYAEPFTEAAEASLSWNVSRLIAAVDRNGAAEIEETLRDFSTPPPAENQEGEPRPGQLLADALLAWSRQLPAALRYRESRAGQIMDLGANAGPELDAAPPVLTLWLRRALRPTAALPSQPPREGERWSEPRAVRLPPWTEVQGTESGEWLPGPLREGSVVQLIHLHVVQQISGGVPAVADESSAAPTAPPAQGRFHAESLAALVHLGPPMYGGYGGLYSAARSASREVTRVVEGVPNLAGDVIFRARISVEIRIQIKE